jgi:signal peptidase II
VISSTWRQPGIVLYLTLVLVVMLLDQISKAWCDAVLQYGLPETVFPGFDLLLIYNSGAAFSFLSEAGGWQRWVLAGISTGISLVLLFWLIRLPRQEVLLGLALSLILGGAVGNLLDRILLGYVVDFISVYYGEYRFATFNLADAAISLGAGLMALDIVIEHRNRSDG